MLVLRQGPSLSTVQLSYVGSVVRHDFLIPFLMHSPGFRTTSVTMEPTLPGCLSVDRNSCAAIAGCGGRFMLTDK